MKKYVGLLISITFGFMLLTPAFAAEPVDPTGTNPTINDTSFAKTIMPHNEERRITPFGTSGIVDVNGITGGRWGATGDEPLSYRMASAGRASLGWLGALGLLGLCGWGRRARH